MPFTVLIPARLASTRLPNKPLANIAGLPMIVRVAQRASQSGASQIVVATDSDAVRAACAHHQVEAILTRSDHASGATALPKRAPSWGCLQTGLWSMCKVTSRSLTSDW